MAALARGAGGRRRALDVLHRAGAQRARAATAPSPPASTRSTSSSSPPRRSAGATRACRRREMLDRAARDRAGARDGRAARLTVTVAAASAARSRARSTRDARRSPSPPRAGRAAPTRSPSPTPSASPSPPRSHARSRGPRAAAPTGTSAARAFPQHPQHRLRQRARRRRAGVTALDASLGGIGGCPFAPDATGNIATEDLTYLLERSGHSTGLDLPALAATGTWIADHLGTQAPPSSAAPAPSPRHLRRPASHRSRAAGVPSLGT